MNQELFWLNKFKKWSNSTKVYQIKNFSSTLMVFNKKNCLLMFRYFLNYEYKKLVDKKLSTLGLYFHILYLYTRSTHCIVKICYIIVIECLWSNCLVFYPKSMQYTNALSLQQSGASTNLCVFVYWQALHFLKTT